MQYEEFDRVVSDQFGLVTSQQLNHLLGPSRRRRLVKEGAVKRIRKGVYRVAGSPEMLGTPYMAINLVLEPDTAISHRSAARLYGVETSSLKRIEVISTRQVRIDGAKAHQTHTLLPSQIQTLDNSNFRVTTPARTILDCAAVTSDYRLRQIVDEFFRLKWLTVDDLYQAYWEVARPGCRWTTRVATILGEMGASDCAYRSKLEARVLTWILDAGLPEPLAEYAVQHGEGRYFLDFAWPGYKLCVEADSRRWHDTWESKEADTKRDLCLQSMGWEVVRVTWNTGPKIFLGALRAILGNAAA